MRDVSPEKKYRFTALPSAAALYNRPTSSDLKLQVGEDSYFAHKNILIAASDVFATMLGREWADSNKSELMLLEEPDCVKVFDRFLYFIYSGNIVISELYVVGLFMLADKYNIKSLYDECTKVIENGLKVFFVQSDEPNTSSCSGTHFRPSSSSSSPSSDSSDSSDFSEFDGGVTEPTTLESSAIDIECKPVVPEYHQTTPVAAKMKMVASEKFPVSVVLKMLHYCQNERIYRAAMFNLEARVGNQICQGIYSIIWFDLDVSLVSQMLADSHFCYPEFVLYRAAVAWLNAHPECYQTESTIETILVNIRYPLLSVTELYKVDKDDLVKKSLKVVALVQEAMKYQLFKHCCSQEDRDKWIGSQFEQRLIRQ